MDGKNSSVNGYISLIIATMIFLLGLLVTITSSDPEGTWDGGRERAPAAICRKVVNSRRRWNHRGVGDGLQTRSFLFIDECIEATWRLMQSDFMETL